MTTKVIPLNIIININGIKYKQKEVSTLALGDLVLDTKDNTYGTVDMIKDSKIAIKDGYCTELGVPISRVRKLISMNKLELLMLAFKIFINKYIYLIKSKLKLI